MSKSHCTRGDSKKQFGHNGNGKYSHTVRLATAFLIERIMNRCGYTISTVQSIIFSKNRKNRNADTHQVHTARSNTNRIKVGHKRILVRYEKMIFELLFE